MSVITEADPGEFILSDVQIFEELLSGGGRKGERVRKTPPSSTLIPTLPASPTSFFCTQA